MTKDPIKWQENSLNCIKLSLETTCDNATRIVRVAVEHPDITVCHNIAVDLLADLLAKLEKRRT